MELCRNEIELAAHQKSVDDLFSEVFDEDSRKPVRSIFDASPVVASPPTARDEARIKNIAAYCRKENAINKEHERLKAEAAIAKQVEASK